jgi:Zn-finger nucleic acid-binding protein
MNCEGCGAPMHLSRGQLGMICDYCGNQTAPPADDDGARMRVVVGDTTSHICPVCEAPLAHALIESQELLYCARCHGMLFNMEKLPLVGGVLREQGYRLRSSQSPGAIDAGKVIHCPLCKREMDRRHLRGGAMMDMITCGPCRALWLDRGRIVAA